MLTKHPPNLKFDYHSCIVVFYISVTEFCERLAYYGFAGSLVLFFETKLNLSNEDAINQFYLWNGFVYVTPLIGGYVADTVSGVLCGGECNDRCVMPVS
jgi:dipeptide/tripeptide permease